MASSDDDTLRDVDALLARFPGPLTLYPSRIKQLVILALFAALALFSVYLLLGAIEAGSSDIIRASLAILVCGGLTILCALQFLPGAAGLTLDARGFEFRRLYRPTRWSWRDVSGFRVGETDELRPILFDVADVVHGTSRRGELPNNGRLPARDIVRLLTDWRARALAEPPSPSVPHLRPASHV